MIGEVRPRPGIVVGAALTLLAIVLSWPATLGGQVFFRRDVHLMWLAQSQAYVRAWSEGAWPLWNPLASFGQPLLADANAQVLYPSTPLLLVMPPWTYYTLYVLAHLVVAGLGAAWLARRLGLGRWPAGCAGAFWMASGPLLSVVDTWNQLAGAAWMPWSMAAGLQALRGSGRGALAWGALSALQLLAGSPETMLLAWAGVAVLGLAQARRSDFGPARLGRAAAGSAAAAALALGLAAAQWVPALDAARRSGRTELSREARTHWSVGHAHLTQAICPVPLHRLALLPRVREELFGAPDPFLPSIYLGAVGVLLAGAAMSRSSRPVLGLAAIAALATLVAMGRHAWIYDALVAAVPPLHAFRYPAKALLLASLAWSLLAARGVEVLSEGHRSVAALAAGTIAAAVCAGAAVMLAPGSERMAALVADPGATGAASLRVGIAAGFAGLATALAMRGSPTRAAAVAALALLDLAVAHHDLNPTAPIALYTHEPAALDAARDPAGGRLYVQDYFEPGASQRLLGRDAAYLLARAPVGWDLRAAQALALREALFPPTASLWGVSGSFERDVPGLEPAPLARLKEAFRAGDSLDVRRRLLRLAGVSRVAALHASAGEGGAPLGVFPGYFAEPLHVDAAPPSLPRAYVVGHARVLPDDAAALGALVAEDFDPASEVVLASGAGGTAGEAFAGSIRVRWRRSDRIVLETTASGPAWVVLLEAWDPGWRVRVDGRPAVLERANLAFRAVAVPPGSHEVEMHFRPRLLGPALAASLASAAVLAAGWWALRPRAREGTAA